MVTALRSPSPERDAYDLPFVTALVNVVDLSDWTGEITPAIVSALVRASVARVIIRASLEKPSYVALARRQIAAFDGSGIAVDLYLWSYSTWDARQVVDDTEAAFGDLVAADSYWWGDIEDTTSWSGVAASLAVQWIADFLDELLKVKRRKGGLYSANWAWAPITGASVAFAAFLLWWACYGHAAALTPFYAFGGWTSAAGVQYADTAPGGIIGDSSVFDASLFVAPAPAPGQGPDVPDAQARLNLLDQAVDANASALHALIQGARQDLNYPGGTAA